MEAVWLGGEAASRFVLGVFVKENGNNEGMLRQVVGDGSMKVTAARMRGDVKKCILPGMTRQRRREISQKSARINGTELVTDIR